MRLTYEEKKILINALIDLTSGKTDYSEIISIVERIKGE